MDNDVTILVINHNQSRFLAEALAGACAQSGAVREVQLHDDGSAAEDVAQLHQIAAGFPQVRVSVDGENLGLSGRLNRALTGVTTAWLLVLAADDRLDPGAVDALLSAAAPGVAVVWGNIRLMDETGRDHGLIRPRQAWHGRIARRYLEPRSPYLDLLRYNNFVTGGLSLVRVRAVREVGGWDAAVTTEDFDMWLRLARSHPFRYADVVTGSYRQVSGSKSRRYSHKLRDNQAILAKHAGQSGVVDAAIARTLWLRWLYTAAQQRQLPDQSLAAMARGAGVPARRLVTTAPGLALAVVWLSLTATLTRLRAKVRGAGPGA